MVQPTLHRDDLDQTLGADPGAYAQRTGRDALERRFQEYAARLPHGGDGRLDAAVLEDRVCPLCGEEQSRLLFEKYGFPIHACRTCAFVFARPMLSPGFGKTAAGAAWEQAMSADHLAFITQPFYKACATKRFTYELQQVLRHCDQTPRRFLEIGASIGLGLEVATAHGLTAVGIEPDAAAYALASRGAAEVRHEWFSAATLPAASFDIAMSLDVLEHVPDPLDFLINIRKVLRPGGLVAIQVPNAGALITRVEGAENQIFNGLIHLNYFDPASLDQAAQIAGFELVATTTFLSELGKLQAYPSERIQAALRQIRPPLDERRPLHQDWINDSGLGYKVLGIYRVPRDSSECENALGCV